MKLTKIESVLNETFEPEVVFELRLSYEQLSLISFYDRNEMEIIFGRELLEQIDQQMSLAK